MGALVSDALRNIGVALYLEESLESFDVDRGHVRAVGDRSAHAARRPGDSRVWAAPNSTLAGEVDIPLGEQGAIKVNERMQTAVEGVWAPATASSRSIW